MTLTAEQIDWIVQEVVRRLKALDGQAAVSERSAAVAGGERSSTTAAQANELKLSERVITMRSLEGRLANVSRVVVQPRAVVTPAVKDELKARKIALVASN